tara:strand:+ start:221 stop:415 length:195 start_codon:yes stop_codon:yes gene_type:complete
MVNEKRYQYIKLIDYNDKYVYINKEHVTRVNQKTEELIEIRLVNETSIFVKEKNLDLLMDRIIS